MDVSRTITEEGKWHRIYTVGSHPTVYESKINTGEAFVSFEDLRREWDKWNDDERREFVKAFSYKRPPLSVGDEQITRLVVEKGDEVTALLIAPLAAYQSDKELVLQLVLKYLPMEIHPRVELIKAAKELNDARVVPALLELHSKLSVSINVETTGSQAVRRSSMYELLYCCDALTHLTQDSRCRREIVSLSRNEDPKISAVATDLLKVPI